MQGPTIVVWKHQNESTALTGAVIHLSSKKIAKAHYIFLGFDEIEIAKLKEHKKLNSWFENNTFSSYPAIKFKEQIEFLDKQNIKNSDLIFLAHHQLPELEQVFDNIENATTQVFYPDTKRGDKPSIFNKISTLGLSVFSRIKERETINKIVKISGAHFIEIRRKFRLFSNHWESFYSELLQYNRLLDRKPQSKFIAFHKTVRSYRSAIFIKWTSMFFLLFSRWQWMVSVPLKSFEENSIKEQVKDGNAPFYRLLFSFLLIMCLFLFPVMSLTFGISWDEPDNVEYATDVINFYKTFGEDKSCLDITKGIYIHLINYGLFFDTFVGSIQSISPFGLYETRHIVNALVGFLAVLFTGLIGRLLWNWRTASMAFAFLFMSPFFFGHAMNNPKDIPFAAGYIMALYYTLLFLKELPEIRFSNAVWLTLSIALVISIRIGGVLSTAYLFLFSGIFILYYFKKSGTKLTVNLTKKLVVYLIGIAGVSYFLGILPWPYGISNPLKNPIEALQNFSQWSNVVVYELFEGKRIFMSEVPPHYIVKLIGVMSPIFVILALLPGVSAFFTKSDLRKWALGVVVFAFVFPIVYAIYKESTLFNGWRHFIFVYPPIVLLSAVGFEWIFSFNKKILNYLTLTFLLVFYSKTLIWSAQNHPHNYVYYNEFVGGYNGAYANYEGDTYANCMRSAIDYFEENLPEALNKKTIIGTNFAIKTGEYWLEKVSDSASLSWVRDFERYRRDWDYAILGTRTFTIPQLLNGTYPPKGTIHEIKVDDKPIAVIVKRENNFLTDGFKEAAKGNQINAVNYFQKAIDYDPFNDEALRLIGLSLANLGDMTNARKFLMKSLKINPESHMACGYLGRYYLMQNNTDSAFWAYSQALHYKMNYSFAYAQRAMILADKGQHREALIDFYRYLLSQASENGKVHKMRNEKNLKHWEDASYVTSDVPPRYLNTIGKLYLSIGNADLAIKYFGYSITVDPDFGEGYYNIGIALNRVGDYAKAQEYFQKAQALGINIPT